MDKNNRVGNSKSKPKGKKKKSGLGMFYFLMFGLFFGTAFYLATNKYFMIEEIYVAGNNKYPNDEIIASTNIAKGENLFKLNRKKIREQLIDKYEYIQDVDIKISFPTSVILNIHQAEPFALLKDGEEFLLISEMGRVLERTSAIVNTKMPIVMGMGGKKTPEKTEEDLEISGETAENSDSGNDDKDESKDKNDEDKSDKDEQKDKDKNEKEGEEPLSENGQIKPGDYISKENNETLAMLTYLIDAFEKTNFTDVTKIDVSDRLNMKIVYQDRLLIELGSEDNLEYKLNFIKRIKEFDEESYFEGVVDVTIPKQLRVREMDIDSLIAGDETLGAGENYQIPSMNETQPEEENSSDKIADGEEEEESNKDKESSDSSEE